MAKFIPFEEQYKHPSWQRKRLEVMRNDTFQCQCCFDREKTQDVHHKKYKKDHYVWEYENDELVTLCHEHHTELHEHIEKGTFEDLAIMTKMTETEIYLIHKFIYNISKVNGSKIAMRIIKTQLIPFFIKEDQI